MLNGIRIIESVYLVEDAEVWVPLGRSGWKTPRVVQVPSRKAVALDSHMLVMHPVAVAELRRLSEGKQLIASFKLPPQESLR
jgi:hypothetical protein